MGMTLDNITLSERCQTQKVTYCITSFISSVQSRQIQRESRLLVTRDWRDLARHEHDENLQWRAAQLCEYAKNQQTGRFKGVNSMAYKLFSP